MLQFPSFILLSSFFFKLKTTFFGLKQSVISLFCGICQKKGKNFFAWSNLIKAFFFLKKSLKIDPRFLFSIQLSFAPKASFRKKNISGKRTNIPLAFKLKQSWRFWLHLLKKI